MSGKRSSLSLNEFRELDISVLRNLNSLAVLIVKVNSLNDVKALMSSGVSTRDLSVKLGNGTAKGDITVLFVHVDIIVSSKILEDDAEVSHRVGSSLEDLANGDDFTLDLSDFVLSLHFIPEVGAGNNGVLSEHSDSVTSGLRIFLSGVLSTDNPVLSDLNFVSWWSFLIEFD